IPVVAVGIVKIGGEGVPFGVIDGTYLGDGLGRVACHRAEGLIGHGGTGKSDDSVTLAKGVVLGEIIHSGKNLAFGKVARSTEKNNGAGIGNVTVERLGANG